MTSEEIPSFNEDEFLVSLAQTVAYSAQGPVEEFLERLKEHSEEFPPFVDVLLFSVIGKFFYRFCTGMSDFNPDDSLLSDVLIEAMEDVMNDAQFSALIQQTMMNPFAQLIQIQGDENGA